MKLFFLSQLIALIRIIRLQDMTDWSNLMPVLNKWKKDGIVRILWSVIVTVFSQARCQTCPAEAVRLAKGTTLNISVNYLIWNLILTGLPVAAEISL